jgi:peptidoglycan/LPS O-acetylase OafA/YrhL
MTAVGICLYHYVCCTTGYINPGFVFDAFYLLSHTVQIFFIISGMVIPISMIVSNYTLKNFLTFLWKRTLRIEPPYLISIIIGSMYLFVRNFVPGSAQIDLFPTMKEIILHLGYLIPFFEDARWINGGYWTLAIEFQFYFVMAIIFPLALSRHLMVRSLFYSCLIAFTIFFPNNEMFSGWASYFLLGLLYILLYFKKINIVEYVIVSIIASIVTLQFRAVHDLMIAWGTIGIVRVAQDWENQFTKFFGDRSYSFYLLHSIIGAPIINFLSHRLLENWQKPLVILLGFVASTAAAHYFFIIIEKPSIKWSKNIKYKT